MYVFFDTYNENTKKSDFSRLEIKLYFFNSPKKTYKRTKYTDHHFVYIINLTYTKSPFQYVYFLLEPYLSKVPKLSIQTVCVYVFLAEFENKVKVGETS